MKIHTWPRRMLGQIDNERWLDIILVQVLEYRSLAEVQSSCC